MRKRKTDLYRISVKEFLVIPYLFKFPCTTLKKGKFPRRIGPIEETRKEGLSKVLIYVLGVELEVPYVRLLPTTMLAFFRARLILSQHGHRDGVCYAWDRVERLSSRRSRILSHRDHSYLAEISPVFSQEECSSLERVATRRRIGRSGNAVCKVSETSRVSAYRFRLQFFFPLLFLG